MQAANNAGLLALNVNNHVDSLARDRVQSVALLWQHSREGQWDQADESVLRGHIRRSHWLLFAPHPKKHNTDFIAFPPLCFSSQAH